jgi:drug/metabolite transporter (DMT)-like permease
MPQLGTWWGLAGAVGYGVGDFCGGLSARRLPPVVATMLVGLAGLAALTAIAIGIGAAVPGPDKLALAAAAGVCGGLGLAALYQAMSTGAMGLVAGLSSAGSVSLALVFGLLIGKTVSPVQVAGMGFAVAAAVLAGGISRTPNMAAALRNAALASLGFAGFLILIDQAATPDPWWVLAVSRAAATGAVAVLVLFTVKRSPARSWTAAVRPVLLLILIGGVADSLGNLFFILSRELLQVGLAAALTGLYPLVTMIAARLLVGESLPRGGAASLVLAIMGAILISIGAGL